MSVYKVTLGIGQTVMGATESYYTPDVSDSVAAQRITELALARNQLMWTNQYWTGIRVSLFDGKRRSQAYLPGTTPFRDSGQAIRVPGNGAIVPQAVGPRPDQFRAVLQWIAHYDVDRTTIRYLSGVSDQISSTEPLSVDITADPTWFTAWQKYAQLLIDRGWQVRARQQTGNFVPWPVRQITARATAPFLIGIVVTAMGSPPFAIGDQVALSRFRAAKGTRANTMNGTWLVESVDTGSLPGYTIVYLHGSAGIDPTLQRFTSSSTIQRVGYSLFAINQAYYNRIGIHKRGRPLLAPRGRRLSLRSLDP